MGEKRDVTREMAFGHLVPPVARPHGLPGVSSLVTDQRVLWLWSGPVHLLWDILSWEVLQAGGLSAALFPHGTGGGTASHLAWLPVFSSFVFHKVGSAVRLLKEASC